MSIFILNVLAGLSFYSLPSFSGRLLGHLIKPLPTVILLSKALLWMIFYMLPCALQDCSHQVLPLPFCKSILHILSHGTTSQAESKANIVCPGQGLWYCCAEAAANDGVISSCSQLFDICMEDEMLSNSVCVFEDFISSKSHFGWSETSGTSLSAETKLLTALDRMKNFKMFNSLVSWSSSNNFKMDCRECIHTLTMRGP